MARRRKLCGGQSQAVPPAARSLPSEHRFRVFSAAEESYFKSFSSEKCTGAPAASRDCITKETHPDERMAGTERRLHRSFSSKTNVRITYLLLTNLNKRWNGKKMARK
ncbi:hypothetical protein ALC56_11225 [Trachymyrmex septentrionalis]|uniref:Uncharacterized protein n=1 Tax=Trachymyrmex septentrionalis TaxID=34720 RepID=A0A195F2X6_9HYME|nr:hypothetical protein ALC56_11225 [Trachymyrmex septentrionalis]